VTRKEILTLIFTVLVIGVSCLAYFRWKFDTSSFERMAYNQVGKGYKDVIDSLGPPDEVWSQFQFNSIEREKVEFSYHPKGVPLADGQVFQYRRGLTMVLVFFRFGVVSDVYVERT